MRRDDSGVYGAMKADKDDVNYSKGMAKSHCGPMFPADKGYCEHFIDTTVFDGECERVRGNIKRPMWCRLFKKAVTK